MFKDKIKVGRAIVKVSAINAKQLYLDTSDIAFINTKMDDNNNIVAVSLEDKVTITNEDKFKITVGDVKSVYEILTMIVEKKGKSVLIYTALPTKTELFLLPTLNKTIRYLEYDSYFVSAQLDHTYQYLCLKYRFTGTERYKMFEEKLLTDPLCVSHIDHGKYYVTYIFKIPLKFKEDIVSFMDGKYSNFSKALRKQLPKFHGTVESAHLMGIIKRDKSLKKIMEKDLGMELPDDIELASKPNPDVEIYKPYEYAK